MIKKGVVTQARANGTWEGKFGLMEIVVNIVANHKIKQNL